MVTKFRFPNSFFAEAKNLGNSLFRKKAGEKRKSCRAIEDSPCISECTIEIVLQKTREKKSDAQW